MWNPFKKKYKNFIVLGTKSFSKEMAKEVAKKSRMPVILAYDVNDVRIIGEEAKTLGDGKAEFLGSGTEQEYNEQVKEDKGLKGIFGL